MPRPYPEHINKLQYYSNPMVSIHHYMLSHPIYIHFFFVFCFCFSFFSLSFTLHQLININNIHEKE